MASGPGFKLSPKTPVPPSPSSLALPGHTAQLRSHVPQAIPDNSIPPVPPATRSSHCHAVQPPRACTLTFPSYSVTNDLLVPAGCQAQSGIKRVNQIKLSHHTCELTLA